ncbi:MAG: tetratricopeptide repeat protein [Planctomycetales bacterium]|nr:tetratricopeptide repeat protein [Planctomycetales bacterium]
MLLYELLTGETPFDKQRLRSAAFDELLRIIREEEPPRPSIKLSSCATLPSIAANRKTEPKKLSVLVRGELDWIVMKAMEKDRTRRYETANQFATDIQHYLADEAVVACPPSAGYRFQKFVRRNRGPMTAAAVTLAALLVVAVGSLIAAGKFRRLAERNAELLTQSVEAETTAREAQQDAENARDREQELRQEAERQTRIAEQETQRAEDALTDAQQQRQRAEANFTLARSAVDEFLNQVTENELLTVPGMQPLRRELLASALDFYEDFAKDKANAEELQAELARASYRIAVIRGELGQSEESASANRKAIDIYEKLVKNGNLSVDIQLGLANAYFRQGRHDEVVNLCEGILTEDATHAGARSLLASTYNSMAVAKGTSTADALAFHQKSLQLRESLVQEFPDKAEYLAELGSTLNNIGVLLVRQEKKREGLAMYERGARYATEAYEKAPHVILYGRWLALGLRNVAGLRAAFGEHDEAIDAYEQVVSVRRKLVFDNPAVASLKGELYKAWMDLGNYHQTIGLAADAGLSFRRAEEVLDQIDKSSPADLFNLAIVYGALATPFEGTADVPDAAAQAEMQRYAALAMQTLEQAVANGFRDLNLIRTHQSLAVIRDRDKFQQMLIGLEAEALSKGSLTADEQSLTERRETLSKVRKLVDDNPTEVKHRETLAATLHAIGEIQIGLEQFVEAAQSLQESLEIRQDLLNERPDDTRAWMDVITVESSLAQCDWNQGAFAKAHRRWKRCLADYYLISEKSREDKELQRSLSIAERRIYQRYGGLGLFALVGDHFRRSVEFNRVSSESDLPELASEGEFSAAVLAWDDKIVTRRYLEMLRDSLRETKFEWFYDVIHFVRTVGATGDEDLLSDEVLAQLQSILDTRGKQEWVAIGKAIVEFRLGQYADAQAAIIRFRASHTPQLAFLDAAIAAKLGNHELAEQRWSEGESRFRSNCQEAINHGFAENNRGIFNQFWWQFAYDQAMRRIAFEVLHGGPYPADPWQHLIQARGYQTIGESELAEAELAAAETAAAGNNEALLAYQQLVGRWESLGLAALEQQRKFDSGELGVLRSALQKDPANVRHRKTVAASLYSIGEVQLGLKQYTDAEQSLTESLQIRKQLHQESPGNVSSELDMLATQYALGQVHWENSRYVEGYQLWQQVMAELDKLSTSNHDDRQLLKSIADIERKICDAYGRLGLWTLAAEYPKRNMRHGRMIDLAWDSRFSPTILVEGSMKDYGRYCRQYQQYHRESLAGQGSEEQKIGHLVWACALSDKLPVDIHELSELGLRAYRSSNNHPFWKFPLALLQCRAGNVDGADQTFGREYSTDPHVTAQGTSKCYCEAILEAALGHPDRSADILINAESVYRGICQATLTSDPGEPLGWVGKYWWELVYADQLRLQAWQSIRHSPPPHTAWRHLLQARGYRVIGEVEKAEAELSAAEAGGDTEVALAKATLFAMWGDNERAEFTRQQVVELAGDDPSPWIQRGLWYVEQGKNEQADQDFAKAASLIEKIQPEKQNAAIAVLAELLANNPHDWPFCERIDNIVRQSDEQELVASLFRRIVTQFQLMPPTADLASALRHLGERWKKLGHHQLAMVAFNASLEISDACIEREPDNYWLTTDKAVTLKWMTGAEPDAAKQAEYLTLADSILKPVVDFCETQEAYKNEYAAAIKMQGEIAATRQAWTEAIDKFERSIALNPADPYTHAGLLLAYRSVAAIPMETVLTRIDAALNFHPDFQWIWDEALLLLTERGLTAKSQQAAPILAKLLRRFPNDRRLDAVIQSADDRPAVEAMFRMIVNELASMTPPRFSAVALQHLGQRWKKWDKNLSAYAFANSLAMWERSSEFDPGNLEDLVGKAMTLHWWPDIEPDSARREERTNQAEEILNGVISLCQDEHKDHPAHSNAWRLLGEIQRNRRNWSEALACFEHALELNPGFSFAHKHLLMTLSLQPDVDPDYALAACRNAIEVLPSDPKIINQATQVVNALAAKGHRKHAEQILEAILAKNPNNADLCFLAAERACEQQDHAAVLKHCNRAIELAPERAWYYPLRASAHLGLGDPDSALSDCNAALRLGTDEGTPLLRRSEVYLSLGKVEESLDDITRAIPLDPKRQWAWQCFGKAIEKCRDMDHFRRCINTLTEKLGSDDFLIDRTELWSRYGVALLLSDDLPTYQAYCARLQAKVAETNDVDQVEAFVLTVTARPESVADWDAVVKLVERFPDASLNARTKVLTRAGQWDKALEVRQELMATRKPDKPNPFDNIWIGLIEQGRGNIDAARQQLENARQVVVDHPNWTSNQELPLLQAELDALLNETPK